MNVGHLNTTDGEASRQRRLFGTDGIRGKANTPPMTPGTGLRLGQAAGLLFKRAATGGHRPVVVIGKDTRLSGYMIEPALTAGFVSVGLDVILVGPLPTPAIAMLTRSMRADLGVMVSASHNAFEDNGIKLFGPDGWKLSDEMELEIEAMMDDAGLPERLAGPRELGRARRIEDAPGRYIETAKASFPRGLRLDGLKVVVDCANGAAYRVAPTILAELGAEVIRLGVSPDGFNINEGCGSTKPETMRAAVLAHGAHLGLALDGDADRLILADETGAVIDGDQLLALIAARWAQEGRLAGGGIVATVMSNMGLERFLAARGLTLHRTQVGDRDVAEAMRAGGYNVGGEQSGHMILSEFSTTGDGLVAALQAMAAVVATGRPASEVCRQFTPLPQTLRNVRYGATSPLEAPGILAAIAEAEAALAGTGRLLIRKSGTEPLIRVMAEGEDQGLVTRVVDGLVSAIERHVAAAGQEAE
jgi:phosphoglucosamine mutase